MLNLILVFGFIGCALGQYGQFPNFPKPNRYSPTPRPEYQQYQAQPQYQNPGRYVAIRSQQQDASPDGSYNWSYETENGISASEQGYPKGTPEGQAEVVQGQYSYTAPDGTPIRVEYVADENGFRAQGAHLPTPPPIPEAIQRALAVLPQNPQDESYSRQPYQPQRFAPSYNTFPPRRY